MKRVWEKIVSTFIPPMLEKHEYREDIVFEYAVRIQRKMSVGTWRFSWNSAGKTKLAVIHPNLPTLVSVIRMATAAIDIGAALPIEVKRSPQSAVGISRVTLKAYLADNDGFYQSPQVLVNQLVDETKRLCETISRVRKKSPKRAEAVEGQCVYLLNEVEYLVKILL